MFANRWLAPAQSREPTRGPAQTTSRLALTNADWYGLGQDRFSGDAGIVVDELRTRRASADDLEDLLGLAEQRRQQYQRYQPQFWRPAEDAVQQQRGFFRSLLNDDQVFVLLAELKSELRGFIIARTVSAPPVYNPGGFTCLVDDFAVLDPADWPKVGLALLEAARNWGADNGAVQLVVVTAHLDDSKRAALQAAQLTLASEWWAGPTAHRPPLH